MIRITIGYSGTKKKILRFDESIEYSVLLRKITNKLGVTHERDDGGSDLSELFQLRNQLYRLVEDTSRINCGDEVILERKPLENHGCDEPVVKNDPNRPNDRSSVDDDVDCNSTLGRSTNPIKIENADDTNANKNSGEPKNSATIPVKKENTDGTTSRSNTTKKSSNPYEKKNIDETDVISISSDEGEDASYAENTEEEYDSSSSEDDYKYESNRKRNTYDKRAKKRKPNPKKSIEPPIEVIMEGRDIPSAPGKSDHQSNDFPNNSGDEMEEKSLLVDGAGKKKSEQEVKHRIFKLLNTGFHDQSNEHEAKNAMKLAQRLMRKHNLSQALLLKERECKNSETALDEEVLKGGMVRVKIINRKTRKPSVFARWISRLLGPVRDNFGVQCYVERQLGVCCDVVFYGIYSNAQLAGYAFKVSTERIAQMMAEYQPKKCWRNVSTKSSRLSYALGIVVGIGKDVERNLRMEKEQRKRKLERAKLAGSRGEAYEESDGEDTGMDNEGSGISLVKEEAKSINDVSQKSILPNESYSSEAKPDPQTRSISGHDLDNRVQELEKEEHAALVLVDHSEKVAEEVLKEKNIKLSKEPKKKPIQFDNSSYNKGIEDSKEIDINQRAIRDEVKVKVEKS